MESEDVDIMDVFPAWAGVIPKDRIADLMRWSVPRMAGVIVILLHMEG